MVAVQHMARKAGKGEVEGTDGYFVTKEAFQAMITEGRFAEHREVAGGVLVGTTYDAIHKVRFSLLSAVLWIPSTNVALPTIELEPTGPTRNHAPSNLVSDPGKH